MFSELLQWRARDPLVDDPQFLADREHAGEEYLYSFNALHEPQSDRAHVLGEPRELVIVASH